LLGVEVYNKPATAFRSGGYIVLMSVAWTALLHAIFFRRGIKPYYRSRTSQKRYQRIEGDYKAWELGECICQFYGPNNPPERRNLEFFVGLRNKIEHRSMPALDQSIFGECQALLFNFEDLLCRTFGTKFALNESLTLALQFSMLRSESQSKAAQRLYEHMTTNVQQYVSKFRSGLSVTELHDMKYSFKVFLIPKLANNPGQADVAVEFVRYDPSKPEEMEKYEKIVAMIKPSVREVVNRGKLKAGAVCDPVEAVIKEVVGATRRFSPSYHHLKACHYYRVRPRKGEGDPQSTNTRYCQYDEAHEDYVYTREWRDFLVDEMKKPGQYEKVIREG